MLHITVNVTGARVEVSASEPLICGTVGATASFSFDETWDGLTKTAVFRVSGITRDVVDISDVVTVPWEVLINKYTDLYVGVYGSNDTGSIVIPTMWARVGVIVSGADPSGDESTDPSPFVWEQMLNIAKEAKDVAQSVRSDADKGAFNGENGKDGYFPVRGKDYWTDDDVAEIKSYVDEAILGGAW